VSKPLAEHRGLLDVLAQLGGFELARVITTRLPKILMYHRLGNRADPRKTDVAAFSRQMEHIARRWRVISLTELCEALRSARPVTRNAVILTFDDAYADFYEFAFPILSRLRLAATLYVPSAFVDGQIWLWPDRLRFVFENASATSVVLQLNGGIRQWRLDTPEASFKAWNDVADHLLTLRSTEREAKIDEIARELAVRVPERPIAECRALTWDQIREVAANGIEIGSHTCAHARLAIEDVEEQRQQIVNSKYRIEEMLQIPVRHFSYPHGGREDFTPATRALVGKAGYESAVVGFSDARILDDVLALRRYSVLNSRLNFKKAVSGWRWIGARLGEIQMGQ